MTDYSYDPVEWLVTTMRQLRLYTADRLGELAALEDIVTVEIGFPDTSVWTKTSPLDTVLVHFELDDEDDSPLGFGKPGVSEIVTVTEGEEEEAEEFEAELFSEAARHRLNFDVGIWVSAEMGGKTKLWETRQALKNLYATVTGREAFNIATEGLNVVGFDGGRDALDRINDLPVWRTIGITMMLDVFSKHTPETPDLLALDFTQVPQLTIIGQDGQSEPVG